MERTGIKADEVLFNSLLDGCCKSNELDLAFKVFENM
jgi:pentatricopeptide repeat protein